jgi:hypothetical protein
VVTTGNDGHGETGKFLEKMLATYGTSSFGTVYSMGAFTPGFFPRREQARNRYKKLARKVAERILSGKQPHVTSWLRKMYKIMKLKMGGVHAVHYLSNGPTEGQPDPSPFILWLMRTIIKKRNITQDEIDRLAGLMGFELSWWRDRGWLRTRNFKQLRAVPIPLDFIVSERLLEISSETDRVLAAA